MMRARGAASRTRRASRPRRAAGAGGAGPPRSGSGWLACAAARCCRPARARRFCCLRRPPTQLGSLLLLAVPDPSILHLPSSLLAPAPHHICLAFSHTPTQQSGPPDRLVTPRLSCSRSALAALHPAVRPPAFRTRSSAAVLCVSAGQQRSATASADASPQLEQVRLAAPWRRGHATSRPAAHCSPAARSSRSRA
jgi:hypothetical protein